MTKVTYQIGPTPTEIIPGVLRITAPITVEIIDKKQDFKDWLSSLAAAALSGAPVMGMISH